MTNQYPTWTNVLLAAGLAGCNMIGPRVSDEAPDAPPAPDATIEIDAAPDAPAGPMYVRPAGTVVPSIADSAELASQIKIFDGLNDGALATAGGVVTRSPGKANGAAVMFWNFGAAPLDGNFAISAPVYVLADDDGAGTLTPRTDHPYLLDSIPGDARYSPIRRIVYVPVTATYAGEVLSSVEALAEAIELGIVGEPKPAGTWRNLPVVPVGTRLELGGVAAPMDALPVYARGYRVDVFPLGGALGIQPLRNNGIPTGQEDRLLSGVATGTPPVMSTTLDAQPVFQYGIPAAPPTTAFNYTPLAFQVEVRLASGVDPTTITADSALFRRGTTGAISGYYPTSVASYTVTTTLSNKQVQFAEGAP
ncbi:MAG: hypothetical protein JWP01_1426 [Myxococcales bacterium]|nr:hypothetical protein [Myxococcales bacterium]